MRDTSLPPLLVIAGPTGVGKSRLAIEVALSLGGEIVNFDSVQVYRGFDIGSAKPSADEQRLVPHHLIDVVNAAETFTAADFARLAEDACVAIRRRGRLPLLVGGTYFYLRALLAGLPPMPPRDEALRERLSRVMAAPRGMSRVRRWLERVDPETAARIAPADRHRLERAIEVWLLSGKPISSWPAPDAATPDRYPVVRIALTLERQRLVALLDSRVDRMFADGLVDETRSLLSQYPASARPFDSIGYREAAAVVRGEMPVDEAIAETKRRTRGYAKRQMTWLRSERAIHWLDAAVDPSLHLATVRRALGNSALPERKE